jgi:hypothetical protein
VDAGAHTGIIENRAAGRCLVWRDLEVTSRGIRNQLSFIREICLIRGATRVLFDFRGSCKDILGTTSAKKG